MESFFFEMHDIKNVVYYFPDGRMASIAGWYLSCGRIDINVTQHIHLLVSWNKSGIIVSR